MTTVVAKVKRWGSSSAVILPAALVKEQHLSEGDEVVIDVRPAEDIMDIFGAWKGLPKIDAQAVKDEIRREENEAHLRKWGVPL
jgi:antitoxin component of MazEF toxin-antitoxin module